MPYGIVCGLAAAFFQSLSYLATRHFVHVRSGGARMLLVLAHIWMGIASIALLPLVWPESGIPWRQIAIPLFGTSFFYIVGQFGLMLALRRAQPSQVAPMLAFKLLVLATLALLVTHTHILPLQWLAIIFCIAGTLVLNYQPHDRLPSRTIAILLFVCFFYGLSDWSITYLVPAFGQIPRWRASMCGSLLSYACCGIVAVPFLPAYGSRRWLDWRDALPFASTWLFAVLCLFTSFAIVGVIYGNILQATRSIMGVFLAALLTHLGHTHIEHLTSRAMFARRLTAAIFMTLALILWATSQPAPTPAAPSTSTSPSPTTLPAPCASVPSSTAHSPRLPLSPLPLGGGSGWGYSFGVPPSGGLLHPESRIPNLQSSSSLHANTLSTSLSTSPSSPSETSLPAPPSTVSRNTPEIPTQIRSSPSSA